ncbi:MAG: ribonuclease HII [Halopenitus sp.]
MVAAAVRCDPAALPADVDDSKQVAPDRRKAIAAELRDREDVAVGVGIVKPTEIDDPETDMNSLTVAAQARAIASVVDVGDEEYPRNEERAGDGDCEAVVDAGDVSESRFGRRVADAVTDRVARDVSVDAEHGADETYPIVSAASVVAKVERDARIAAIDDEYPEYDVGSGYPSDPTTRCFLEAYVAATGRIPDCARRSWSTCEQVLAAAEQSGLDEF